MFSFLMQRFFERGVYLKKYGNSDKKITSGAHLYLSAYLFMGGGKAGSVARSRVANLTDDHRYKSPQQKHYQSESNNTLKGSYTMINWDLSQGCKDSSISENQSM